MKTSLKSLLALAVCAASSIAAIAQPTPKIVTVDFSKVYEGWYRTEEFKTTLQADMNKAKLSLEELQTKLNAITNQYKDAVESAKSAALSAEAKKNAEAEAIKIGTEGQKTQGEIQNFQRTAMGSAQERQRAHLELAYEESKAIATDIAKKKGANLVIEKSGTTAIGIPAIFYSDAGFEITDEVLIEMNRKRPAASATPAAPAAEGAAPSISFPGAKK